MGFGVPLGKWFRDELRSMTRDVLLSSTAQGRGYFRPAAVEQLITEHESGNYDHSHRLWSLLFFELWQQEWVDKVVPQLTPASLPTSNAGRSSP
jgi:asparagine synthase (glutamine-hydrolysing)